MSGVDVLPVTKQCPDCGEIRPLDEFHRDSTRKDGRATYCRLCNTARVRASQERRRQRLGDDAYRQQRREAVAKHRERTGNRTNKAYVRARNAAIKGLIAAHRREFEERLSLAKYEEGLL